MFNVIILGLTSFFTDISSEMVYPLIPFFLTTTLGASPAILGVVEGVAESLASLLKVFSGYISDRFRDRKILAITGYSSSAIGKVLLFLANSWGFVFAGRIVDRFGKGSVRLPATRSLQKAHEKINAEWHSGSIVPSTLPER